jgi:hypothetical protein
MTGFAEFGPQNSVVAVPEGTGGGTWRDRGGCVKAKQLHVKDVVVGSKTEREIGLTFSTVVEYTTQIYGLLVCSRIHVL